MKQVFLLVLLFAFPSLLPAADTPPNIVFILADDLGYGDVSAFNSQSKIETAHIDRLAAEGVRFTDAHSGGSVCIPSRYALLTGRFAARKRLQVREGPVIDAKRETIASMLKQNGYKTAMVGKWHQGFETSSKNSKTLYDYTKPLRGGPVDRGFDSFFGMHASLDIPPYFYMHGRVPVMSPTNSIAAKTSVGGKENWNHIQGAFWRAGQVGPDFKHEEVTPRFAAEAIEVIRSHRKSEKKQPLFLYLALPSPHTPWLPLKQFRGKSGAGMYGDFVLQVDAVVNQIVAALETAGMTKNTLLIFSSDNGPVWYDKDRERFRHDSVGGLRGMKNNSWEGGHRMPFIARWPNRIPAGSVCARTIAFSDIFATLAELVGQKEIPHGTAEDSVSFLPWLFEPGKTPEKRAAIVHDRLTIRDGDWKLILPRNKRTLGGGPSKKIAGELYNLKEDRGEKRNRFEEEPKRVEQMKAQLEAILGT